MINELSPKNGVLDEYSEQLVENLNVFTLLKDNLECSLRYIEHSNSGIKGLAFRSLYLDIHSFIDELTIFEGHVYQVEESNFIYANNFLLLTHELRKFLKKYKKQINLFRNSLYAHNYRDKKTKQFIDPLEMLVLHHEETPVFFTEVQSIAQMCICIVNIAKEQFLKNENISYGHLLRANDHFKVKLPKIEAKKAIVSDNFLENFYRDLYQKKDYLKGSAENYRILSKKLRCKILDA